MFIGLMLYDIGVLGGVYTSNILVFNWNGLFLIILLLEPHQNVDSNSPCTPSYG